MMNRYTFISKLSEIYPNYINYLADQYFASAEVIKTICDDVGFKGSVLALHNHDIEEGYDYSVILKYIEEHEEVKSKLLFREL